MEDTLKLKHLKIGTTDIFLDNKGEGKGKITISDTSMDYNFSHYWGAMGCDLEEFIQGINEYYFSSKLNPGDNGVFCPKSTMRNVRKFIKEELSYELPWYSYLSAQKELRERLREIENACNDEKDFIDYMMSLTDDLMCYDLNYQDETDFKGIIKVLGQEPWSWIEKVESPKTVWLKEFLPKLKKGLALEKPIKE